jgi:hypothetical protein
MTWWLLNEWQDRDNWEIVVVFANTGKEDEGTLFFVDECAQEWGIDIVWIEAKCIDENGQPYSEKGWKVKHRIVTYETASRKGEPFEEMISMLGIPSTNAPFCSYQLKRLPIIDFATSIGWDDYHTAIGIRIDESNRFNPKWDELKIFYPFASVHPTNKSRVNLWWNKQSFDLNIHPDDGNCDGCWKKGDETLARIMIRKPEVFIWWEQMTAKYGQSNPRLSELKPPFHFYRRNKSVEDIRSLAKLSQAELKQLTMFDEASTCSESCEVF